MSVLFSFVGPIVKIDLYPKGDEMVANKVSNIIARVSIRRFWGHGGDMALPKKHGEWLKGFFDARGSPKYSS